MAQTVIMIISALFNKFPHLNGSHFNSDALKCLDLQIKNIVRVIWHYMISSSSFFLTDRKKKVIRFFYLFI